jgi:integrase/recombinase XerD
MDKDFIVQLRHLHDNLMNSTEATVKSVVVEYFLTQLGYQKLWFACEEKEPLIRDSRKDICIYIDGNKNEDPFFIEVKHKGAELDQHIDQLSKYLNQKGISWGMLTNGHRYILFNNRLTDLISTNRIVLDINLLNEKEFRRDVEYFSCQFLFKNSRTNYLIFPTIYKHLNKHIKSSTSNIQWLLNCYFRYLANEYTAFDETNIKPYTFKEFLFKNKTKKYSRFTIGSRFRYIKSACDLYKEKKHIKYNYFDDINEEKFLSDIDLNDSKFSKDSIPITYDEINSILEYYDKNSRDALRNKVIILLTLYCALDLQDLIKMRDDYFNDDTSLIVFPDGRKIKLTTRLSELVKELINLKKKKNVHCKYLFYRRYEKGYDKISKGNYNTIISRTFNKLDLPEDRKKVLIPSFIRSSVIRKMFNDGFSIEDIICLTGLSLTGIGQYLSYEDILKRHKLKKIVNEHPYKELFV